MKVCFIIVIILFLSVLSGADEIFHMEQCRVLDTRNLGGPIVNGTEFSFRVRGQVGGLQGGTIDCGIPIRASGVVLNITVVPVFGAGHLEVYPFNKRPPQPTSRINYPPGIAIANEIIVRVHQPFNSQLNEVTIRPVVAPSHVIADIIAFTTEPNPTFPIIKGRFLGEPFMVGDRRHVKVQTIPANGIDCSDEETCFDIECSPGAEDFCIPLITPHDGQCVEVQGYRRPYSSEFEPHERLVGTIFRGFMPPPASCPWEN